MSLVYWDSIMFVYLLERHPGYFATVETVHQAMRRRGDTLCTSIFTLGEVLVGPRKLGLNAGIDRVKAFFASGSLRVLPFGVETADQFASVRAWTEASPADAVHLAAAAEARADIFLTNDQKIARLTIPGIGKIAHLDPTLLRSLFP
ncbi:MAG: PIN domain-containing protein [Terracidiphilus sp.]